MLDLFGVSLPAKPGNKKGTAIRCRILERVKGIEPSSRAWEAFVLPLNYTRNRCVLYRGAMGQVETGCEGGHDPVASVPCRSASCCRWLRAANTFVFLLSKKDAVVCARTFTSKISYWRIPLPVF